MTDILEDLQTVPVHVTNAHELHQPAEPRNYAIDCKTFTLKTGQLSGDPNGSVMQRILDRDLNRTQAIIEVFSGTVYLCHTSAAAESAIGENVATLGGPQDGFILAAGTALPPLKVTDPLWAVVPSDKASTGALVSVIAERRRA